MIVIDEQEVKPPDSPKPSYLSGPGSMEWSGKIIAVSEDASDMRRRIGAAALEMDAADGSSQARWRDIVAARLPKHQWPRQRVLITAVNAQTGESVVFDSDSGVDLVDAVAASTSNGFGPFGPYRVAEHRYLDGGYRRGSNTDLAAGYGRVLVLDPFSGRSRHPLEWGMALATQVDELRTTGSIVEIVFPDARSGDVFNANALNPSTRLPAA
ncbi:patatin-like phospholipase family protein [Rathayibacter soli]|uniref:patatin-like phospholipase family protein n=1 Tax=Rathayibacter soli TaxID=3144168 RepID=UPI0027E4E034|nr:hypothetical protein [Glaciibacter superstes]